MRAVPAHISDALTQSALIGDYKPSTRVTVWTDWWLHVANNNLGNLPKKDRPIRWWASDRVDPAEKEIPSVVSVTVNESIDQEVCDGTVELVNAEIWNPGDSYSIIPPGIARKGWFTPDHGDDAEARERWGHEQNEWNRLIEEGAVLRVYQGYGGEEKDLEDALADGNVMHVATLRIDDLDISGGRISVTCRGVGSLLIDQPLMPPLVPSSRWPLTFYRWVYSTKTLNRSAETNTVKLPGDSIVKLRYRDSEAARWYGGAGADPSIYGHHPTHAVDGSLSTWYLSVGNSGPDKPFSTVWWEGTPTGPLNAVYVHPWGGNYECFVSVYENGRWVDTGGTVPYDPSSLYGNQPRVVDTGANIPFVTKASVPWEKPIWIKLPRVYKCTRVRVSFRHLTRTAIPATVAGVPVPYRAGIKEIKAGIRGDAGINESLYPFVIGGVPHPVAGYWLLTYSGGRVYPFGDAQRYPPKARLSPGSAYGAARGSGFTDALFVGMDCNPAGSGYWIAQGDGSVSAHGSVTWYGDLISRGIKREDVRDIAATRTGLGYYLICRSGRVYAFGDAVHYGNATPTRHCTSIETHPTDDGYWTLEEDGTVEAFGLPHYGNGDAPIGARDWCPMIRRTFTGDGYYVLNVFGKVYACGDAVFLGNATVTPTTGTDLYKQLTWTILPHRRGGTGHTPGHNVNSAGYMLARTNGNLVKKGANCYFGQPSDKLSELRRPGNITDLSDVVRSILLWAGWWLDDTVPANQRPKVFGNIEDTGTYPETILGADMFDKKSPVDAIRQIKEGVGYLFYTRATGEAYFGTPNWWSSGNFDDDTGQRSQLMPVFDEKDLLLGWKEIRTLRTARSEIVISNSDPLQPIKGTVTTRFTPRQSEKLRGVFMPAMLTNEVYKTAAKQRIMAELIAIHLWFKSRQGAATVINDLRVQPDDQCRIYEEETGTTGIHYVRGVTRSHDLISGDMKMQLTTNWLGDADNWVITTKGYQARADTAAESTKFVVSDELLRWAVDRTPGLGADETVITTVSDPIAETGVAVQTWKTEHSDYVGTDQAGDV